MTKFKKAPEGYKYIYRRYITRNGKRIYPKKSKYFRFLVKID